MKNKKTKKCFAVCSDLGVSCPHGECRYWIDFEDEFNCSIITAKKNGDGLILDEVAKRIGLSLARINQVDHEARKKVKKMME